MSVLLLLIFAYRSVAVSVYHVSVGYVPRSGIANLVAYSCLNIDTILISDFSRTNVFTRLGLGMFSSCYLYAIKYWNNIES
jgi:hypothetical protein